MHTCRAINSSDEFYEDSLPSLFVFAVIEWEAFRCLFSLFVIKLSLMNVVMVKANIKYGTCAHFCIHQDFFPSIAFIIFSHSMSWRRGFSAEMPRTNLVNFFNKRVSTGYAAWCVERALLLSYRVNFCLFRKMSEETTKAKQLRLRLPKAARTAKMSEETFPHWRKLQNLLPAIVAEQHWMALSIKSISVR